MEAILVIIYFVLGWWAINKLWYNDRVYLVYDSAKFYTQKLILIALLGWILIPIAIIKSLVGR